MNAEAKTSDCPERDIFFEAIEKASETERAAYVKQACGGDLALRRRVEVLLADHSEDDGFMQTPVAEILALDLPAAAPAEQLGTLIGRYKLLEQIGEGGFGVVYMAEQEEPVRRKVALKIIKLGMDTRQVIARFEAERQALAMMDHPNIAKVLDAGATETGRPYFVMELVRGIPITKFCEENRLTIKERLKLFIPVCQAIQHAHQKGVIHRDIKPSNVLVTMNEGIPHPMVIDFGVAKAIDQRLTEKTLYTRFAQMIGTPAYMSPEQAEMSKQDVDTRTDVYSLGILLYELLTGTTPFPEERLRDAGYAEIQRIISQEEPVRPSTLLSRLNGRSRAVATSRRCEPASLLKLIKGDLDWIVLKAIDKDRNRRYATPNELAADLQRHLTDEPVTATPPSTVYRVQKFVRRNRVATTAGALVVLALLSGLALALVGLNRAARSETVANQERERAAEEARRARRNLYFAEIKLANQAISETNPGQALRILERQIPNEEGVEDLRGWEWSYLWSQIQSGATSELGKHETTIRSLAYSPDGALAASSDYAGNISIWDAATKGQLREYKQSGTAVIQVLFYSNSILVSANDAGIITFYDLVRGRAVQRLDAEAPVQALALSPQRDRLAAQAGRDSGQIIKTWIVSASSQSQSAVEMVEAYTVPAQERTEPTSDLDGALAFSPSGDHLAAGYRSGLVRVYDSASGALRRVLQGHRSGSSVSTLAYSNNGRWLASGADGEVRVWDAETGRQEAVLPGHVRGPRHLVFSKRGDSLFVACGNQTIHQWKTSDWSLRRKHVGHYAGVNALAMDPSGTVMLSGGGDRRLLAWNLSQPESARSPLTIAGMKQCEFSPSGDLLATIEPAVEGLPEDRVCLRTAPYFKTRTELPSLGDKARDISFSEDGRYLAALSGDAVRLWDLERQRLGVSGSVGLSDSRLIAGFTADGGRLLLVDEEFTVTVWNAITGDVDDTWSARRDEPLADFFDKRSLAFDPVSGALVLGGRGQASVWDVGSRACRGTLSGHGGFRVEPVISRDGALVATLGEGGDKQVRLWNARTLELVGELETPPHPIYTAAFSSDNRRMAVGLFSFGQAGIFDVETGRLLVALPPAPTITQGLQWSPDGTTLVIQGEGGVIWNFNDHLRTASSGKR